MSYLYIISCLILAVVCFVGIVSDKFHDNLIQRIALGGMIFSCVGFVSQTLKGIPPSHFDLFINSVALYALATTWKLRDGKE